MDSEYHLLTSREDAGGDDNRERLCDLADETIVGREGNDYETINMIEPASEDGNAADRGMLEEPFRNGQQSFVKKNKWLLLIGVVGVVAVLGITLPLAVRRHQYNDGDRVAAISAVAHRGGFQPISMEYHDKPFAIRDRAGLASRFRKRHHQCPQWDQESLIEFAEMSETVYSWRKFKDRDEHVETNQDRNIDVRALVFSFGTFRHGWFSDYVEVDKDGAHVLAYEGTSRIRDWVQNIKMFCNGQRSAYMAQAVEVARRVQESLPEGHRVVAYTGHSLGGALAAIQVSKSGSGCSIGFNSPPIGDLVSGAHADAIATYRTHGDVVSLSGSDLSNAIGESLADLANRIGLDCNSRPHIGMVKDLPETPSESSFFGRLFETVDILQQAFNQHRISTVIEALHML